MHARPTPPTRPFSIFPALCITFLIFTSIFVPPAHANSAFTPAHLAALKNRTAALFSHGWHAYVGHAFPADEVRPFSCVAYGPQYTPPDDIHIDALGNVLLTALDNLDLLVMFGEWDQLADVLQYLRREQATFFHQNHVVQVFEATIRWLGGLLLAHLALSELPWRSHAVSSRAAQVLDAYDGFLLDMAFDLGCRLVPAYMTLTQLPLPRINLALGLAGVPLEKNRDACTAGATTPLLEFTLLSRLTGDERFEKLTRATLDKLWNARLALGLLPMSLDPTTNQWLDVVTGVGALVDSFYEYAVKAGILFGDDSLTDMFLQLYMALAAHLAVLTGPRGWAYYANIHTTQGTRTTLWIDALLAFWPGLQVLAGRLSDAVASHAVFLKLWNCFDAIPERWETTVLYDEQNPPTRAQLLQAALSLEWYPLRPEFIELTYYLYRATRDPLYLEIGARILRQFETQFKAPCGFAGFQDLRTGERQDRMETFVLGELLKYLYLLFDDANEVYVHWSEMKATNWVFSTEAHPLWYLESMGKRSREKFQKKVVKESLSVVQFRGRGVLGLMWRNFVLTLNDIEPAPALNNEDIRELLRYGPLLPPLLDSFDFCEIEPVQLSKGATVLAASGYSHWDQLFSADQVLKDTLIRPEHLGAGSAIELSESFLRTHAVGAPLQCARIPTTVTRDYFIGTLRRPESYEIYTVAKEDPGLPFGRADLVMPEFGGRVKIEVLSVGAIDSNNHDLTSKYFEHVAAPLKKLPEILRVLAVNGYPLLPNATLWTLGEFLQSNPDVFGVRSNGDVYIWDKFVENLRAH